MANNLIKAMIVDDEPGSVFTLKTLLEEYCPGIRLDATTDNPLEAKNLIMELKPDLLFLDIEMPFANAFDLLDSLKPLSFEVIFVTAFNDYAIKAFRYSAVDYLLKPISISELVSAVERVKKVLEGSVGYNSRLHGLLDTLKNANYIPEILSLPSLKGIDFIDLRQVVFIEASGNYSEIHQDKGKKLIVTKHLKDLEDLLPVDIFCRVHHSFIVNMMHVSRYIKGRGGQIVLSDGTVISISVRKKTGFLELLKKIKEGHQGNF